MKEDPSSAISILHPIKYIIFLLSFISLTAESQNISDEKNTEKIMAYLDKTNIYATDKSTKDSAFYYLNQAGQLFKYLKDEENVFICYNRFSSLFNNIWTYEFALQQHFKSLENLNLLKNEQGYNLTILKKYDIIYWNIAACFRFENMHKAITYLLYDLDILSRIQEAEPDSESLFSNYMSTYNALGNAYMEIQQPDSALYYFQKALALDSVVADSNVKSSLYNNLGIYYSSIQQLDSSNFYLRKSLSFDTTPNTYYNIALNLYTKNKPDSATLYADKALNLIKMRKDDGCKIKCLLLLSDIEFDQGNYKQSSEILKQTISLKDSITQAEKDKAGIAIEMQYLFKKQTTDLENQIAFKEKQNLVYILISILLVFAICMVILLYRNQRAIAQKKVIEQENLKLKNEKLEQELTHKQKEQDMYAQYLLKHNEHIKTATQQVSGLKGNKEEIMEAMKTFESNIEKSVWSEFQILFQNLHNDFYEKLYEAHPNLTLNEKKICVLIRLNMSTKDICAITGQQIRAVEAARTRLRTKLGLKRSDNLTSYLQQF